MQDPQPIIIQNYQGQEKVNDKFIAEAPECNEESKVNCDPEDDPSSNSENSPFDISKYCDSRLNDLDSKAGMRKMPSCQRLLQPIVTRDAKKDLQSKKSLRKFEHMHILGHIREQTEIIKQNKERI